jgi:hypothetical protein
MNPSRLCAAERRAVMDKYADRSRSPRSSPGVVNRVAEIQRRLNLATESREARAAFGFVAVFAEERLPPIS